MREPARDKGRLADILEAAAYLKQFTDGVKYSHFLSDKLRYFAVLKNVEIVGETATKEIPDVIPRIEALYSLM